MNAINPWLRGIPVGFVAFLVVLPTGFGNAVLAANIAWIAISMKFSKDQAAFEAKLLHRKRLYSMDIAQAFAEIQKAMANVWLGESHWQIRTADVASGYMLYRYEWREPESTFDDGKTRHHANLQIDLVDRSDAQGAKTLVTYSFDGLPNLANKCTFYDAVHLVMGVLDAHLPDHVIVKPEPVNCDNKGSHYIDHEMLGA